MSWSLDARIPVSILPEPAALAAALATGKPAALVSASGLDAALPAVTFTPDATSHAVACACCQGRSSAAQALDRLFQARVRGESRWFDRVLVLDEAGMGDAIRTALREDALAAARYRLV